MKEQEELRARRAKKDVRAGDRDMEERDDKKRTQGMEKSGVPWSGG